MSKVDAADVFEVKKVRVEVEIPLDEAMVEHRGMRLAQLGKTRRAMEQDMKDAASAARKELKKMKKEIATLEDEVTAGAAKIMVDAEERANFDTNQVDTFRMDDAGLGLLVSSRPMTAEERQLAIDVDAELPPRDPPKQVKVTRRKPDAAPPTH